MPDYAIVIPARLDNQRLYSKVLSVYCSDGTPSLAQIVRRHQRSRRQPAVIVSSPDTPEQKPIVDLCREVGVPHYSGHPTDVVRQMDGAVKAFAPDARFVARGMADNPLVDTGLADWRLDVLAGSGAHGLWYLGDESRMTYAATMDVWSREGWEMIVEGSSGCQNQHPGLYFWDNLSRFNVIGLQLPPREYLAPVRTELDTERDLEMLRRLWLLYDSSGRANPCIDTLYALDLLASHPDVAAINADVPLKTMTKATWPLVSSGTTWSCKQCSGRNGAIIRGDLEVRCPKCGKPEKFYFNKPRMGPKMTRH